MPLYRLSLIVRPLGKANLVEALKSCCTRLLEDGAVVTKLESLGHRDLPYKMKKGSKPPCLTGSYMLVDFYSPPASVPSIMPFFKQHNDVIHYHFEPLSPVQPVEECMLHEELKPPAYRKFVEELRARKKMDPWNRFVAIQNARRLAKLEPKSFHIAPFRG